MKFLKKTIALMMCAFMLFGVSGVAISADAVGLDDIVMNDIFSDHMVLQREKPVEIYGRANAGAEVTVTFKDQTKTTTADANGNFSVYLDPMEASATGAMLKITSGSAKKIFTDVLVGEVYYASGQSNMAYPMDEFTYAESVIEADSSFAEDHDKYVNRPSYLEDFNNYKNYKNLRFYTQKMMPETNGVKNQGTLNEWISVSNVSELKYTSLTAVAYAMRLSDALGGIPVGIMVAGVGGSQIHEWISREAANEIFPGNTDSTLCQRYENMVVPMGRFTVRGVLWYQGESDVYGSQETYRACFNKWVEETRNFFQDENLPIITFQLPQYEDEGCKGLWPAFRQLQEELANEIEGVYYVCGIDLGDHKNIHPTDKYEFCGRAAGLALKYIYNQSYSGTGAYGSSPVVTGLYRKKGSKTVYMTFANAQKITIGNGNRVGLTATTNEQVYADISNFEQVDENTISFESKMKYVSYLQANIFDYSTAFMYNEYGLPVAPFVKMEVQSYDYDVTVDLVGCESDGAKRYYASSGENVRFTITPKDGYEFVSLTVNGVDMEFGDGTIELTGVNADTEIKCVFKTTQATPDIPDTPDTPDTPDAPDTPDTPDTPNTPDTPDTPNTPNTPDNTGDSGENGNVVGIVVAAVGIVAVIAIAAVLLLKKRNK